MNATLAQNEIEVIPNDRTHEGLGKYLTARCPEGWNDVKKICKKILIFQGVRYSFSGWCSDTNRVFFRECHNIARIVSK